LLHDCRMIAASSGQSCAEPFLIVRVKSAPLAVAEPDPRRRLEAVHAATADLKDSKQALGAEVLSAVSDWTAPALLGGDASADGEFFFLGDYGIREQEEWGIGVVDRSGTLRGKVVTDPLNPPMSIAALN